jgi:hypothetical protein
MKPFMIVMVGSVDRIYVVIILTIFIYQDQLTFYNKSQARRYRYLTLFVVHGGEESTSFAPEGIDGGCPTFFYFGS